MGGKPGPILTILRQIPVMVHDMVILQNHGFVTVGADLNDAIQKAAFFELACEVIVRGGESIVPIAPEIVGQIRQNALKQTGV